MWLCNKDYNHIAFGLRKGNFSENEARSFWGVFSTYRKEIVEICRTCVGLKRKYGGTTTSYLQPLEEHERNLAILRYGKERWCLDIYEHSALLKESKHLLPKITWGEGQPNNGQEEIAVQRAYEERLKKHLPPSEWLVPTQIVA